MKPEQILALTFSDKAATEMRDRLEQVIDPSDLTIATFHSFCLQVLKDNVFDSGISLSSGHIDRANQLVWALRNIDTFGFEYLRLGNNAVEVIESVMDGISAFRDELITPDELEAYLKAKQVWEKLGDRKRADDYFYGEMKAKKIQQPWRRRLPEWLVAQFIFGYGIKWVTIVVV